MINPLMTEEGKKFKSEIRNRRDISVKEKQELIKQFVDNYGKTSFGTSFGTSCRNQLWNQLWNQLFL
jgi:hypothetical protein